MPSDKHLRDEDETNPTEQDLKRQRVQASTSGQAASSVPVSDGSDDDMSDAVQDDTTQQELSLSASSHTGSSALVDDQPVIPNTMNLEEKKTKLLAAAEHGDIDTLRGLFGPEVNINAQNEDGSTALHLAAKHGHTEVIRALLDAGADVEISNEEGRHPLHLASRHGYHVAAQVLLTKANPNAYTEHQDEDKKRASLHIAAKHGHAEVIQALLDASADVEIPNGQDERPLHLASIHGKLEAVKVLLTKANPNTYDSETGYDDYDTFNEFRTALHIAIEDGHTEITQALLDAGVKLNALFIGPNSTVLHIAAEHRKPIIMKMLIDAGAGALINAQDVDAMTALDRAAESGCLECVQILIDAGATVVRNESPVPVLCLAFSPEYLELTPSPERLELIRQRFEIAKILIHSGANPYTILGSEISRGQADYFLEAGIAIIDSPDIAEILVKTKQDKLKAHRERKPDIRSQAGFSLTSQLLFPHRPVQYVASKQSLGDLELREMQSVDADTLNLRKYVSQPYTYRNPTIKFESTPEILALPDAVSGLPSYISIFGTDWLEVAIDSRKQVLACQASYLKLHDTLNAKAETDKTPKEIFDVAIAKVKLDKMVSRFNEAVANLGELPEPQRTVFRLSLPLLAERLPDEDERKATLIILHEKLSEKSMEIEATRSSESVEEPATSEARLPKLSEMACVSSSSSSSSSLSRNRPG